MDNQPVLPHSPQPATGDGTDSPSKKSPKKKILTGFACIFAVLITAGTTFGVLSNTMNTKADIDKKSTIKKVETLTTIDAQVQTDIEAAQEQEDKISDEELQTITQDIDSTKSLEENYADF